MTEAANFINNPGGFYIWIVKTLGEIPNPNRRDSDFLFDVGSDTWEKYKGLAMSAANGAELGNQTLPDGKMIKKIVMSRAYHLISPQDRRTLIRIWAHTAITSAKKGTPPSGEFIEFIAFILRKCPEQLLEKGVKEVQKLKE